MRNFGGYPFQISGLVNSLHGDTAKIYVSTIKEYDIGRDFDENDLGEGNITPSNVLESILCTRLDEKVYCGLINLMNACYPNTSDEEIEKALVSYMKIRNSFTLNL